VRLWYKYGGENYQLNLIDTPGHVDFTSEVTKSISCSEAALLIIDAAQGVEAQTVANLYHAQEKNLKIIPIINKIDLPGARIEEIEQQIEDILQIERGDILKTSAKEGIGIKEVLDRIVRDVPAPIGKEKDPLKAMVFDSYFDVYRGVILYLRIFNGSIKVGDRIKLFFQNSEYTVEEVGILTPYPEKIDSLGVGEVGFIAAGIKSPRDVVSGDTVTSALNPTKEPLTGFRKAKPMVYAGLYPVSNSDFTLLRDALEKLSLTDFALTFEPENSPALGPGFRSGFLGLLHMDIIQERIEREFKIDIIITTPNVKYIMVRRNGEKIELDTPAKFINSKEIRILEPFVKAYILIPTESIGSVMELSQSRRGMYKTTEYYGKDRVGIVYELPLAEILVDFHDKIKSATRGYGSLDYEFLEYRDVNLVRIDILLNGELCEALSVLIDKDKAQYKGRQLVHQLRSVIPKQLFEVAVQAAIGGKIVARETVAPLKKNVTGKCYGGDITRKRKLWSRQSEGKKRMKKFGKVDIPQEAFLAMLKLD
ncbi:MAG: translation elongation factor 4, partial [Candidatus Kaelpia aquatica]|nr:translation elongation factor 4 [Candidatus Kaelpia aquatica]